MRILLLLALLAAPDDPGRIPVPTTQTDAQVEAKSKGCLTCHTATDAASMHAKAQPVGCADCHGGHPEVAAAGTPGSAAYKEAQGRAHVRPRRASAWPGSRNPERSYTDLLAEDLAFVRFVNPGDLRAAPYACGPCHDTARDPIVRHVAVSPMTTGAMLYGAALYNNGVLPGKTPLIGESYGPDGIARLLRTEPEPDALTDHAIVPLLVPFPRWELSRPGNIFRVFERGGRRRLEVALPDPFEDPGRPDKGLSPRGFGTGNRTDPIVLGAQKTRLVDPLLSLLGTNDHPGDYRSSGCSACHVVYANDGDPANAGPYAEAGNRGTTASADPTIPRGESGHPLRHAFTRSIPSSQCMTCHMHPGTNMVATYLGYTWWDNEVDGEHLYPKEGAHPKAAERDRIERANPEGAAVKGRWSDPEFLAGLAASINPQAKRTQFGDFHGHGWVFRKVYAQDRKGRLLDAAGAPIPEDASDRLARAVHLKDIHLEKGMHCVDCHFAVDSHGTGQLHGEPRAAVEIDCVDCHGTVGRRASVFEGRPSGPAATPRSLPLGERTTPFREPRFDEVEKDGRTVVVQRSMVTAGLSWEVPQVVDTVTPGNPRYNERSRLAKTIQKDGRTWGDPATAETALAHADSNMTCYACHSAWTTSCFGCHLSMKANQKKPNLHNEGGESRNWTSYNFETLRDDIYFLARQGPVARQDGTKDRIAPARSACAVNVSSQNQDRAWIYAQKQTLSAAGYAGTAFAPYVPHTVRGRETKGCPDCHVAQDGDNNAWMASLLMQGTGLTNYLGRNVWVGEGERGLDAVVVTERDEPQAVIGSTLHALAYPDESRAHAARGMRLMESHHHGGRVLSLQAWGEYLFAAQGADGLRVYDIAQIDHKGFSQRISSAPVSPLGQRLYVKTKDAAAVALPSTQILDPGRPQDPQNLETPLHPLYSYAYVADREEGLVVVGPLSTLLDGDPANNFLARAATWNEGGVLDGASSLTLAGSVAWVTTPAGLAVVSLEHPLHPRLLARLADGIRAPRAVAVQFRYAFVIDADGLKVVDATSPAQPRLVPGATVGVADARALTLARTYAYVAGGREGLLVIDVERPEAPRLDQAFTADGVLADVSDVEIGMTNGSAFAYVANGAGGLAVVQVISANDTPGAYGFSPRPTPRLIATARTRGPALAVSRGVDRDRAVDETGHQTAVFGRKGSRPLSAEEQRRLYLKDGTLYTVTADPPGPPAER